MLKNDTLKNGTSRIGVYGSAPPGFCVQQAQNVFRKFQNIVCLQDAGFLSSLLRGGISEKTFEKH